jgi:hypothetical protein
MSGNLLYAQLQKELEAFETSLGDPQVYNNPKALERALQKQESCLAEYLAWAGIIIRCMSKKC